MNAPKIIKVKNPVFGSLYCRDFLLRSLDKYTVLFLSGGSTPKNLYELLAKDKKLKVGAVALVDERFGKKMYANSNEKMIKETGFLEFLKNKNIPFYPILKNKSLSVTSLLYEKQIAKLFKKYKNKVAILGIGEDGHIAGIPAVPKISKKIIANKKSQVAYYDDKGKYGKRITITPGALEKFDNLIVLVFSEKKKKALNLMFKKGLVEQIPARFLTQSGVANRVTLITDQRI